MLAAGPRASHLGRLLRQWSADVVLLTNGGAEPDDEAVLDAVGVPVVREPIERFVSTDGRLTAVEFAGRESLERDALFFHVAMRPRTALAAGLGCELNDEGYIVAAPMDRATSVDRVYAVGNCAEPMHNVPMAIADGSKAGALVNFRLVEEGVVQPAGGQPVRSAAGMR